MKTTSYRFLTSLIGLACGAACTALALDPIDDDQQAPTWRGGAGLTTTWQKFTFDNPAAPLSTNYWETAGTWGADASNNTATVQVVPGDNGHWKGTFPWATNKAIQGVWNVNPGNGGKIEATIQNAAPVAGVYKYVVVQTVEFQYPYDAGWPNNITFNFANVAVANVTNALAAVAVNQTNTWAFNGQGQPWVNRRTVWVFDPAPGSETITVTPQSDGSAFDSVIVDTLSVTTPVCPGNISEQATGPTGKNVTWAPLTTDAAIFPSEVCVPPSGSLFDIGATHPVQCTVTDLYGKQTVCGFNVAVTPAGYTINGQVELELYVGLLGDGVGTRLVTFKATDDAGTVLKQWDQTLTFAANLWDYAGTANYSLDTVPTETTHISAKTVWNLRKRLPAVFTAGVATVDFIDHGPIDGGSSDLLRGGDTDLNWDGTGDDNIVDSSDFNYLSYFYTLSCIDPDFPGGYDQLGYVSDLDGSGIIDSSDFNVLSYHYTEVGDPE